MNELKFNSQICTTKEQSERLLKLGLKPETADCYNREEDYGYSNWIGKPSLRSDVSAWSLHRLIEMLPDKIEDYGVDVIKSFGNISCIYDKIIYCIEWLISEGYFNKEYLNK